MSSPYTPESSWSDNDTSPYVPNDHAFARDLAIRAGELLLDLRPSLMAAVAAGELDGRAAGKQADRAAQALISETLRSLRDADPVLSEEATDRVGENGRPLRLVAPRAWIVDPLDGTREYCEDGRTDWAVHVALWSRSIGGLASGLAAGAVALPAQGITLSTVDPVAIPWRDPRSAVRVVVSRSRPPAFLDVVADTLRERHELELDVISHGSAGGKTAEVVLGRADVYLHDRSADGSGLDQWDAAAPAAVAHAAGLHVSHLDGSPLTFNTASPVTGDFLVCRPELASMLLRAVAPVLAARR